MLCGMGPPYYNLLLVCAMLCGMDRLGIAVYSLQLIVYCLRLISWLFADNLQISCDFLGGFEEKAYFCGRVKRLKGEDYGIRDKKHSCFDR